MSDEPTSTNHISVPAQGNMTPLLLTDLRQSIQSARERVAVAVNAELTMLYWRIGARLRTEVLKEQRAEYGRQIVEAVAEELLTQFGKGFKGRTCSA